MQWHLKPHMAPTAKPILVLVETFAGRLVYDEARKLDSSHCNMFRSRNRRSVDASRMGGPPRGDADALRDLSGLLDALSRGFLPRQAILWIST